MSLYQVLGTHQREAIQGVHHGRGQPDGGEGSHAVDNEGRLVVDLLPLQKANRN